MKRNLFAMDLLVVEAADSRLTYYARLGLQLLNYKITALMSLILSEMYPGYSSNCTFNLLYRHGHYKVSLF